MPALQLLSSKPVSGKTALAAGLGQGLANAGLRVRLVRTGTGDAATADAAAFATLLFASSPGIPIAVDQLLAAGPDEFVLVELDAGSKAREGLAVLLVVLGAPDNTDVSLARGLADVLVGTIATRVPTTRTEAVARALTDGGLRPLAILPEDRILAAPSVDEIRAVLAAELLYDGENGTQVVEDVLIGPVYADPAGGHFQRFGSKAVLAPFNKTDLLLAAIEAQAACVVVTGGRQPSPYVVDRAQGEETTLLLAPKETPQTLADLGDIWFTSRFRGGRKTEAMFALLKGRLDFAALARKLGS